MPLAAITLLLALQTTTGQGTPAAAAPKPQVKVTELAPGKGDVTVRNGDLVEVNYVGKLTNGNEFDRSKDAPFRFQVGLGKVIAGWDQGVIGMKTGEKRRLQIPAVLAYGAQSMGPNLPANSDLDFEVEVVRILRAKVEIKKPGSGVALTAADVPTFHYTLTLTDGKKIDSSRDRNAPATARLANLIPGFVQGLLGMKPGEIRKVTLIPELAYGDAGVPAVDQTDEAGKVIAAKGSMIPPNSTLVFEIELVSSAKAEPEMGPG